MEPETWQARQDSLAYLETSCAQKLSVLGDVFSQLDRCIGFFEAEAERTTYARLCGLTLIKAKNYSVGAYSLMLDGLGQEAGALLRPSIEYCELLTYFYLDPTRVEEVLSGELPSAGARAQKIGGIYKDLREHLNRHASHSSYSEYSLAHLLEPDTKRFKKAQRMVPHVLEQNLLDFAVQSWLLLGEACVACKHLKDVNIQTIAADADELKARLVQTFGLDKPNIDNNISRT